MEKKLGKGLSALIPEKSQNIKVLEKINSLEISTIVPNKHQPRKKFNREKLTELKNSIREKGIIQPVVVRKNDDGYELIAGERRLRAIKELGLTEIPAIIKNVSEADSLEMSLIENIQREELNAIEEAEAYRELMEKFNFSQDEIAKAVGRDKSTVSNTIRLLSLPKIIKDYISEEAMSMGHAKALMALPTERAKIRFSKRIIKNSLSVRQAEEIVKQRLERKTKQRKEKDVNLTTIEENLQHILGTRVRITHGKKRGKIEIYYYSNEDLERVINIIRK